MGQLRDRMDADLRLAGYAESTRKTYLGCAERFVKHFMRPPEEMGEEQVRQFMLHLTDERGLSTGARLGYLGAIKFLFGTTLQRSEVTRPIPWPRQKRRPPVVPTRREVKAILDAAPSHFWRTFFTTTYAAGLRRIEAIHLRAQDIDSASGLLRIEATKGDKPRAVMLDPGLLHALREHWRAHRLPGPWLFPTRGRRGWLDRPIRGNSASTRFRDTADRAGLDRRVTLHGLRHAFATHLLEDGVDLVTLQALLGHSNIETTAKYIQVRTDHIRATPSLLSKLDA